MSSIPLSGSFEILCYNVDGTSNTTGDIPYSASLYTIKVALTTACSSLRDTMDMWEGTTYSYYVDGRDLNIRFSGLTTALSQFTIYSGTTTALTGNSISYAYETPTASSTNIFYEPIPFELLHTYETEP